ncbi:MAG: hypothetical protein ACXWF8_05390 [Methylobacter sp.]
MLNSQSISDFIDDLSFVVYPVFPDFEPYPDYCYVDIKIHGKKNYCGHSRWVAEFTNPNDVVLMFAEHVTSHDENYYDLLEAILINLHSDLANIRKISVVDPFPRTTDKFTNVKVERRIVIKPNLN